jgi:hypothetical protein
VYGCPLVDGSNTKNCPRAGGPCLIFRIRRLFAQASNSNSNSWFVGTRITIEGSSFGAAGARVIVGGLSCNNVTHDAAFPVLHLARFDF